MARQRSAKPFTAVRICSIPRKRHKVQGTRDKKGPGYQVAKKFQGTKSLCLVALIGGSNRPIMKYSSIIGILACIGIIISCFIPWTYHPDLSQYFNGFYSEQNIYGRPGKLLVIFAAICILLFAIPRVWAKRTNWLMATLLVAYTIKTYFLFTSCYNGICPVKEAGMYLLLITVSVTFIAAMLPDLKLRDGSGRSN